MKSYKMPFEENEFEDFFERFRFDDSTDLMMEFKDK